MISPLASPSSRSFSQMRPFLALTALGLILGATACGFPSGLNSDSSGQCASGVLWTGGDRESPLMRPGGNCITCHADRGEGPRYTTSGTVMDALDAADDCSGIAGAEVVITDADGQEHRLTTNEAGNFFSQESFATPVTVQVEFDGKVNAMSATITDLNCMNCHTAVGANSAPGRILTQLPATP